MRAEQRTTDATWCCDGAWHAGLQLSTWVVPIDDWCKRTQLGATAGLTHDRRHMWLRDCDANPRRQESSPARCCRREMAGRCPQSRWLRKVVSNLAVGECMAAAEVVTVA